MFTSVGRCEKIPVLEEIVVALHTQAETIFKGYGMGLAYLFGSHAATGLGLLQGKHVAVPEAMSDIDIGVVFLDSDRLLDPKERYTLYASLHNDLTTIFPPDCLDLVFLQTTHAVFQSRAISGHCVYAASQAFQDDYEHRILARAADFRVVLDRYYAERLEDARS